MAMSTRSRAGERLATIDVSAGRPFTIGHCNVIRNRAALQNYQSNSTTGNARGSVSVDSARPSACGGTAVMLHWIDMRHARLWRGGRLTTHGRKR
jgi:hypothetical protein